MKMDNHDKRIVEQLKDMPIIEDPRNKDELFQRVSSQLQVKKERINKVRRLIPIFCGILAIAILFIIVRPLIDQTTSLEDYATEEKSSFDNSSDHHKQVKTFGDEDDMDKEMEISVEEDFPSYVIQEVDSDAEIIYGAVSDDQLQSVIPLSIIVPDTEDINVYYNQIGDYLNESEWGTNDYLFKEAIFDIDISQKLVTMELPEDFSVGEGTAGANMFGEVLQSMFKPYQIDKVVFNDLVELGPIGEITEYPLQEVDKVNYKLFQASNHQRDFLIPIKLEDEATIEEAIVDLKNGQTPFNIFPTVPSDVELSFTSSDEELVVTFEQVYDFESEEEAIMMIESILMTAKNYDYNFVTFMDAPIDVIGPYHLSDPIQVPVAVNPVYPVE